MAIPVQLNDKSGGFMVVRYGNGHQEHKLRVHVAPFGTAGTAAAQIPYDRSYTAHVGTQEATLGQTFVNLVVALRGLFDGAWYFHMAALYQNSAPGVGNGTLTEVFPTPSVKAVEGTNTNSNDDLAGQITLSMPSSLGGKGRVVLLSSQEWQRDGKKDQIDPNMSGSSIQITAGYLLGLNMPGSWSVPSALSGQSDITTAGITQIQAHDGGSFATRCIATYCLNHRLRRSYGMT